MAVRGNNLFIVFLDRASESGRDAEFESSFLAELDQYRVGYGFLGRACRKNPLKGCLALARFRRRFRPDVIHSHLYYGAVFSLLQLGVPHVYTHHNIKLKTSRWLYRLLDIRTKAYVGICQACETLLSQVTRRQVIRIDNGVSLTRIIKKRDYKFGSSVKLVCVGTLGEQKNHSLLFNALARLPDLDFTLTVAGEGAKKNELLEMVLALGIDNKVSFIGNFNNVKQLLHDSDLFVMSSAWEGLPIAQIEATLTGLPVLVTNVGGCAEIVQQVGNGLVAEVELDDYAEKLKRLIVDEALRLSCHQSALENAGHYTVDNAVDGHLALYERLTHRLAAHA
ncbi:glycosyltransferase family 4 protein [Halomonas campisalis]|uniref:Glycosyltransferase family 4 protein n=2 Tax=Billgrantia campisalis TaxID=74661 RepID=A0ABS9P3H1_9GAMM|nr:glycosyltransferase family 4 protein [Halomonas campisalis]